MQRIDQQPRVDELVGKECIVLVVESGACLDRPGRGVDLVIKRREYSGAESLLAAAIQGIDTQIGLRAQLRKNGAETVFGKCEDDRYRFQLRDHRQRGGTRGLHDVAGVHQTQTDPAGDGSGDVAVVELQLIEVHGTVIILDGTLGLLDEFFLVRDGLLGDGIAGQGRPIAREVKLRLRQDALIVLQCALSLHQRRTIGSRVNVNQRITLFDALILLVIHRHDHAVDLAGDGAGVHRRHRADGLQVDADIALDRRGGRDGHSRNGLGRRGLFRRFMMSPPYPAAADEHKDHDQ